MGRLIPFPAAQAATPSIDLDELIAGEATLLAEFSFQGRNCLLYRLVHDEQRTLVLEIRAPKEELLPDPAKS